MMNNYERGIAIDKMRAASKEFYAAAVAAHVHPFIEFAGLINEYIRACEEADKAGIDFSDCNTHSGRQLPLRSFQIDYINEKLECIFTGHSVMREGGTEPVEK